MEQLLNKILGELQDLKSDVGGLAQGQEQLGKRFDGMETRFDGLEERFNGMETRFDGLEERFNGMETRFDGLEERFTGMEIRFDGLEERFNGMEIRFDGLEECFTGMETRFDGLEIKVDEIQGSLNRIEEGQPKDILAILDRIEKKMDGKFHVKDAEINILNQRVFRLETQVEQLNQQ